MRDAIPITGTDAGPFTFDRGFLVALSSMGHLDVLTFTTDQKQADEFADKAGESGQDVYVIPVGRTIRRQPAHDPK